MTISIKTGIRSEEVLQREAHVLFVEGENEGTLDPKILNILLEQKIRIEPLGPSPSIKSVAMSLFPHHPTYYFLVDRDHCHDEPLVQQCWDNFPDPTTHNLLIWRRREIENYFLDPAYLQQSKYCTVDTATLEERILHFSQQRLYLDAANYVIVSIREKLKKEWIHVFSNPQEFKTEKAALEKLAAANEFKDHQTSVCEQLSSQKIRDCFTDYLDLMTDGQKKLSFGRGDWLSMIQGKKILSQLIHSNVFVVKDRNNTNVTGKEKTYEVAKELLTREISKQPEDFQILKRLIWQRIKPGVEMVQCPLSMA